MPVYFALMRGLRVPDGYVVYSIIKIIEGKSDDLTTVYESERQLIEDNRYLQIMMFERSIPVTDMAPQLALPPGRG